MADDTVNVYEQCAADLGENAQPNELLACVSNSLQAGQIDSNSGVDAFFLIFAASLVFFMQAGFAMLCAGSVRFKNVQNTMLKNLLDACGASLGFFSVGYAFAYGGSEPGGPKTFIGNSNFFLMGVDDYDFWLFQFAFAATSATIVAGTLAERCQMTAYLCYSIMLTGFVYPVIVHSIWSPAGFLSAQATDPLLGVGMVDFAGSAVVHMTGGFTALIATRILGARRGRFYDDRGRPLKKPKHFPGHSFALQMLGAFILWFGWYGFNAGSAITISSALQARVASLAAVNTTLSAASAGVTALFVNLVIVERKTGEAKFNITYAMNGCLAGLVSITAGCSVLEPWAGVIVGFIAGLIYLGVSNLLIKLRLDDAVDAIPVHLASGIWGCIAVGLLAAPENLMDAYGQDKHVGWFYSWGRGSSDAALLACQIAGIVFVLAWVFFIMTPFFTVLNYLGWFRADSLEEIVGLDISYHGGSASNHEDVKPEYMEAFRKRKQEVRSKQRSPQMTEQSSADFEFEDRSSIDRISCNS